MYVYLLQEPDRQVVGLNTVTLVEVVHSFCNHVFEKSNYVSNHIDASSSNINNIRPVSTARVQSLSSETA